MQKNEEEIDDVDSDWNWAAFFFTWIWAFSVGLRKHGSIVVAVYGVIWLSRYVAGEEFSQITSALFQPVCSLVFGALGDTWRKRLNRGNGSTSQGNQRTKRKDILIGKEVLEIYDKYDCDFGLLDERWASEQDRQKVTLQQTMLLSEYVEKLHLVKCATFSVSLKAHALKRIEEIEKLMEPEVVETLRARSF